jgi:hypothetical protein
VKYFLLTILLPIFWVSCNTSKNLEAAETTQTGIGVSQDTLRFRQPDGSYISILGIGNMFESYQETLDGYSITTNEKGFYYIAKHNANGDLVPSNIKAYDPEERPSKINRKLKKYPKHLRYKGKKKKEIDDKKKKFNSDLEDSKQINNNYNKE